MSPGVWTPKVVLARDARPMRYTRCLATRGSLPALQTASACPGSQSPNSGPGLRTASHWTHSTAGESTKHHVIQPGQDWAPSKWQSEASCVCIPLRLQEAGGCRGGARSPSLTGGHGAAPPDLVNPAAACLLGAARQGCSLAETRANTSQASYSRRQSRWESLCEIHCWPWEFTSLCASHPLVATPGLISPAWRAHRSRPP